MARLLACLLAFCLLASEAAADSQLLAVQQLLHRLLPDHEASFELSIDPTLSAAGLTGAFSLSTPRPGFASIRGSDGISLSSGIHHYLKYVANCSVSWLGDNLRLPVPIPTVPGTITKTTTYEWRYYLNTCTYGYSTAFWDFERWVREIDWMALNGINMPLAFEGQEWVFREMFTKQFGLTADEVQGFFSGPAVLPWNRMGNLDTWLGPLPLDWIERHRDLQLRILEQMRSFGMRPVLPAFSGLVPAAFAAKYPDARIRKTPSWQGFPPVYFLESTDPLFDEAQTRFITLQTSIYGTDHLYNCDLYNENLPPTNDPAYLKTSTQSVYQGMKLADAQAVWVMQGWLFHNDEAFWQPPQMQAVLNALNPGEMLVLDLYAESFPIWTTSDSFYGTQFIWTMLQNFGGRSGLEARLPIIATQPAAALVANGTSGKLVGLGLTPEAIETNPIAYDLMMENVWRGTVGVPDLDSWVRDYVSRRYYSPTGRLPSQVYTAWKLLQDTVYNCPTGQSGTSGSIISGRPALAMKAVSCCDTLAIWYNPADVVAAFRLLLEAVDEFPELGDQETFGYDLVSVASVAMSNLAASQWAAAVAAYNRSSTADFVLAGDEFLSITEDLDELLGTQRLYLLGTWVESARAWGTGQPTTTTPAAAADAAAVDNLCTRDASARPCGAAGITVTECQVLNCCWDEVTISQPCYTRTITDTELYERNARTQVTLWGTQTASLSEYAYKLWSGLVQDYYYQRWQQWFRGVHQALLDGIKWDDAAFKTQIQFWEERWTTETKSYPTTPSGNAVEIARTIYRNHFLSAASAAAAGVAPQVVAASDAVDETAELLVDNDAL